MTDRSTLEAPRIFATLRCTDAEAMIVWLIDVLGFTEHAVYRSDGVVVHAELAFGRSLILLGQSRDDDYGQLVGDLDGRRTDAIYIAVDDPDALYQRVNDAGAVIETKLHEADYGNREFACRDPEGNLWCFGSYWPTVDEKAEPSRDRSDDTNALRRTP